MSSAANSPREIEEVEEQTGATPEENENANQEGDPNKMSRDDPPYDFEVKEQDRWLPIANGESPVPCVPPR